MINSLFNMHHKIKLKLDAICQEAGDMDVEEFIQVYNDVCLRKEAQEWAKMREEGDSNARKFAIERKAMYTPSGIKLKSKMEGETYGTAITNRFREDMIDDMDMGQ